MLSHEVVESEDVDKRKKNGRRCPVRHCYDEGRAAASCNPPPANLLITYIVKRSYHGISGLGSLVSASTCHSALPVAKLYLTAHTQ